MPYEEDKTEVPTCDEQNEILKERIKYLGTIIGADVDKLETENKQLKEELKSRKQYLDERWLEIDNLKQKLEKYKERKEWLEKHGVNIFGSQYVNAVVGELKELLDDKEKE